MGPRIARTRRREEREPAGGGRPGRASVNFLAAVLYFLASSAASAPAHLSLAAVTWSRTASGVCSACAQTQEAYICQTHYWMEVAVLCAILLRKGVTHGLALQTYLSPCF